MGDFTQLRAWKAGMELVDLIYRETERFSATERFGLQSQIRRAAVSVPANIAEGTARGSDRELVRFLRIAGGSAAELECVVLICVQRGLITDGSAPHLLQTIGRTSRLLIALRRGLDG